MVEKLVFSWGTRHLSVMVLRMPWSKFLFSPTNYSIKAFYSTWFEVYNSFGGFNTECQIVVFFTVFPTLTGFTRGRIYYFDPKGQKSQSRQLSTSVTKNTSLIGLGMTSKQIFVRFSTGNRGTTNKF